MYSLICQVAYILKITINNYIEPFYLLPLPLIKIGFMYKQLFIILGFICVALGVLGIFLPVLPTTPFLLLAAWLFAKSSDKLYNKLLENKYVGNYIKNFREHRSIPMPTKIFAISMIWISIGISVVFAVKILFPHTGTLRFRRGGPRRPPISRTGQRPDAETDKAETTELAV